jgi:hypothetical protein
MLGPETGLADGYLDPALAVHLHAARIDGAGLGMHGGGGMALGQQRAHAEP